jgi:hypothetical protein
LEIVLGVSMAPTTVRMVLIEGQNADGVTVEQDTFGVVAGEDSAAISGAADQVIGAIVGTREGAIEGGYRLASTGVTWTDPAGVGGLRDALARGDVRSVMLVSPLLAAAALAQTVGNAIDYEYIAMVFVEPDSATLAVVEIAGGSIVELHRRPLTGVGAPGREAAVATELAAMVAGLDAPDSRADGVFIVGCGVDIVGIKTALEAATALVVSAPEEPDMALARGAALASANAPLFASSTAALAYALDPGTGELNPGVLSPTYLDVSRNADLGAGALAYSALDDVADDRPTRRRRPMFLAGSALAAIGAAVAGVVLVSLMSDRPTSALQHNPRVGVDTPAKQMPAQVPSTPPEAQLPAPSAPPPAVAAPPAPAPEAAAPPAPEAAAPPAPAPVVQQAPQPAVNTPPAAPPRRAPTQRAPQVTPTPAPQAPAPTPAAVPSPEPAAVPSPEPAAPAPSPQYVPPAATPQYAPPAAPPQYAPPTRPPLTMYLRLPFVTVPIPINPPPPPAPSQ